MGQQLWAGGREVKPGLRQGQDARIAVCLISVAEAFSGGLMAAFTKSSSYINIAYDASNQFQIYVV